MFEICLHNQPLKTPKGNLFKVPTLVLAKAIEGEWQRDPTSHYLKKSLTSLAATTLDQVAINRKIYEEDILRRLETDTLLFWEERPRDLVNLQEEKWLPLIKKVNQNLGLHLKPTTSLALPNLTLQEEQIIKCWLSHQPVFGITGVAYLINLTGSFCLSYLSVEGALKPEKAWEMSLLHEKEQRRLWGEDSEVLEREAEKKSEFLKTIQFINLSCSENRKENGHVTLR